MQKLLLLYLIILSGVTFLLIPAPTSEPIDFFLFSDTKLQPATYIYFWFEKIIVCILAYLLATEEKQYKFELQAFFWLMVADAVDYGLSYGGLWFRIGSIPVTMNIFKSLVFGLVILRAWSKQLTQ